MTFLKAALETGLAVALVAVVVLARYAQLEHRRRLKRATDAYRLGGSQKIGDISQLLGTFDVLTEYDEISLLSSTAAQSSMDLLGRKGDQLDFIEFKKGGRRSPSPNDSSRAASIRDSSRSPTESYMSVGPKTSRSLTVNKAAKQRVESESYPFVNGDGQTKENEAIEYEIPRARHRVMNHEV
jgi:hypothetical protein